jgi:hypothetical protein
MIARFVSPLVLLVATFALTNIAQAQDELHTYFVDVATEAKAADDADQKRSILTRGLTRMNDALTQVQSSPAVNENDLGGIRQLQASVQDKIDELQGSDGFSRVADSELDAFADYMVQDIEQAQRITISLVALLLIIIIVILIT